MTTRDAVIMMGPSGCGKSTIGMALAQKAAWPFLEGDDFHPATNIKKMATGSPLEDADRIAWIDALVAAMAAKNAPRIVLACSALTPYVQQRLINESRRAVHFVMLQQPRAEIATRLSFREGHFMSPNLLNSQIASCTPPENAIEVDALQPVSDIVGDILKALGE